MTFRVETLFDQTHTCPTSHDDPDHIAELNLHNWTCRTCQKTMYIEMVDRAGNCYTVERVPAREIRKKDFIVYRQPGGLSVSLVTASNRYPGKGNLWHLAAEGFGSDQISPEQYVSRIPG